MAVARIVILAADSVEIRSPELTFRIPTWVLVYTKALITLRAGINTAQKMKFSIKDFFSKCDQIRSFRWIWSHFLKKSLTENFIFCAVKLPSTISAF